MPPPPPQRPVHEEDRPALIERISGFLILLAVVIAVWGANWWLLHTRYSGAQPGELFPDEAAEFGDMFGAVNALFSGAALAGVVYAILLQRRELALQRREIRLTREAQERSERALTEQAKVSRQTAQLGAIEALYRLKQAEYEDRRGTIDVIETWGDMRSLELRHRRLLDDMLREEPDEPAG